MVRGGFVKFITVLGLIIVFIPLPLAIFFTFFPIDKDIMYEIALAPIKAFLPIGILCMILYATVGIPEPKVELLKYPVKYDDFESFTKYIEKELNNRNYIKLIEDKCSENVCVKSYFRENTGDLYIVASVKEFTKDTLDDINRIYYNDIRSIVSTRLGSKKLRMSSVLCVKKVSNLFYNFIKMQNDNNLREFRFRAGISFGGRKIYLPDKYYGIGKAQMESQNMEFRQIMGIGNIVSKKSD